MTISDFNTEFNISIADGNLNSANATMFKELGRLAVEQRNDFIYLLKESGVNVSDNISDTDLVDLYIKNLSNNKYLALGSSLLVNHHNKVQGFDGEEINDRNVKAGYVALTNYLNADGSPIGASTLGGAASGGIVGTIAGAVGDLAKLGTQVSSNRAKKKYGLQDIASKQMDAKAAMTSSILALKQKQLDQAQSQTEQKAKTKRVLLISVAVILELIAIVGAFYIIKKK